MSQDQPFLQKDNVNPAAVFVGGPLWADIKRCLLQRKPASPLVNDSADIAAAKGHQRTGFEKAIEELEGLPFEVQTQIMNPMDRPAIQDITD